MANSKHAVYDWEKDRIAHAAKMKSDAIESGKLIAYGFLPGTDVVEKQTLIVNYIVERTFVTSHVDTEKGDSHTGSLCGANPPGYVAGYNVTDTTTTHESHAVRMPVMTPTTDGNLPDGVIDMIANLIAEEVADGFLTECEVDVTISWIANPLFMGSVPVLELEEKMILNYYFAEQLRAFPKKPVKPRKPSKPVNHHRGNRNNRGRKFHQQRRHYN